MCIKSKENGTASESLIEYIDGLYSYALMLARNRSDAEDLVQETYVRALPAIGRLREDSNLKGWLFTILRNIWLNHLRRRQNSIQVAGVDVDEYPAEDDTASQYNPHSLLISRVNREQVQNAIQRLPRDAREIILLREYEEMSYQEIAGVLNCPVGTVMSRLCRARSRLRTLLTDSAQVRQGSSQDRSDE
jgi:RNA polymerase sigma-70 factor, ECF subfamily